MVDATAMAQQVRSGEATRELAEAAIERIEALNPQLNAVITPLFEKDWRPRTATSRTAPSAASPCWSRT